MKYFLICLMLCFICGCTPHRHALANSLYFAETGHTVASPFVEYYQTHRGPQRLGLPVTEAITDEGWQVQYFQYGRLEQHPENQPDYFITVGWLSQLSNRSQPPQVKNTINQSEYFSRTGHSVSGDFLTYFKANGGTVQFGFPISQPFIKHGLVMQDFQSARFIWQPELPPQARVQLEPLGETYFLAGNLPLSLLWPVEPVKGAIRYQAECVPLPDTATAALNVETTSRRQVIRVTATIMDHRGPVVGYAPLLVWQGGTRQLPPSRSNGQTHTLLVVDDNKANFFSLQDPASKTTLATTVYQP